MFEHARFEYYADRIRDMAPAAASLPESLRVAGDDNLEIYYAPFDYCNQNARLVICGLTPGLQQAAIALNKARELLRNSDADVLYRVKAQASFAGAMRRNLAAMLDYIGVPKLLAIDSSSYLFGGASDLVHYTSALRLPVFARGENYRGAPSPVAHPLLRNMLDTVLVEEVRALGPEALWLPLGGAATQSLQYLVDRGILREEQLLAGLPHPSGANAERIACFLDRKPIEKLSAKTNATAIHGARDRLVAKINRFSTRVGVTTGQSQVVSEPPPGTQTMETMPASANDPANVITTEVRRRSTHASAPISYGRDGLPTLDSDVALRSSPGADTDTLVWVPVARDRTIFCSNLRQANGGYRIGAKGEGLRVDDLYRALGTLRQMQVARWRRPSATTGTPGIVSSVGWTAVPRQVFTGVQRVS